MIDDVVEIMLLRQTKPSQPPTDTKCSRDAMEKPQVGNQHRIVASSSLGARSAKTPASSWNNYTERLVCRRSTGGRVPHVNRRRTSRVAPVCRPWLWWIKARLRRPADRGRH